MRTPTRPEKVRQLVSNPPLVVGEETSLRGAAQQLEAADAAAALVGHARYPVGIVSEHHLSEAVADGRDLDATAVRSVMTPYFTSVDADLTIEEAQDRARSGVAHHVAVTQRDQVIAVIAVEDILRITA